jgi:phenylalanyl-tRNA synthetase beta chain
VKISLSWLSEYVDFPPGAEELAERLTLAGFEVEKIDRPGEALKGVVVARIVESALHPSADKLSVTKVDAGGPAALQVVCGAKNYRVGDKVPLAPVGTRLPNGMKIREANLRGVASLGMLCSAKELGLSEDASGLMILDPGSTVGAPLAQVLGLDDAIFEIEVTPNRPDALSHLGIAREVSALTGNPVRPPDPKLIEGKSATSEKVRVRIEDPIRCRRYGARVVEGVTVGPSPAWMSARLRACGVRSINNVVDVTNYLLLEYGQPMHAFDLDKIHEAEIVVRTARPGEQLTTLDGKERMLDPEDLLICDRQRALAIGGVMGGADTEVSATSRRVLLEAANFQPSSVRRSAKRHALHTEASHRFERGADINAIPPALDRAAALIAQLGGGTVLKGIVDAYPTPWTPRKVRLRYDHVMRLLGAPVASEQSHAILESLGFKAGEWSSGLNPPPSREADSRIYSVPSYRVDVEREEDLIEEVARIRGYDSIPDALPRGVAELAPEPRQAEAERRLREALTGAGFYEVVNYSFVSPMQLLAIDGRRPISLLNPLSAEQSVMRTTLYAGLLQNVAQSLRHHTETIRIYELGRVYRGDPQGGVDHRPVAQEPLRLSGALYGRREGRSWTGPDAFMDFFDVRGALEALLCVLNIEGATYKPIEDPRLHPRASASLHLRNLTTAVGTLGELHPQIAKKLDLPPSVFVFDLDAEALFEQARLVPQYRPLPRYPAVLRDLAVVVPIELRNEEVRKVILEVGAPLVSEAVAFDVYTGKPIPEGRKNLAYALTYRSPDRTLTDVEVNEAHERIVQQVQQRLGGQLRA